jgi:hypothetical protein
MFAQRQTLGETVTQWLEEAQQRPGFTIIDILVRQSSDAEFHCLTILVFFTEDQPKKRSI